MLDKIDGYILTGGLSSRMGEHKGRIVLGGRTFARRVADALSPNTRATFTVGSADLYPEIANVNDIRTSNGATRSSIAGLGAALRHADTEWIFVVACDFPFVTASLFEILRAKVSEPCEALIPVDENGRDQPLCALYRAESCLAPCLAAVREGQFALRDLVSKLEVSRVEFENIRHLRGSENFFRNVNTPRELAEARILDAGNAAKPAA